MTRRAPAAFGPFRAVQKALGKGHPFHVYTEAARAVARGEDPEEVARRLGGRRGSGRSRNPGRSQPNPVRLGWGPGGIPAWVWLVAAGGAIYYVQRRQQATSTASPGGYRYPGYTGPAAPGAG